MRPRKAGPSSNLTTRMDWQLRASWASTKIPSHYQTISMAYQTSFDSVSTWKIRSMRRRLDIDKQVALFEGWLPTEMNASPPMNRCACYIFCQAIAWCRFGYT